MSNLFQFLTELAIEPCRQVDFLQEPNCFIEQAGLSKEDETLLKHREKSAITAAFSNSLTVLAEACGMPDTDPLPDEDPLPDDEPPPDAPENLLKRN